MKPGAKVAGHVSNQPGLGLWPLARRLAWQEGVHGSLRGFVLALALCVASILCISLLADRLQQALALGGREFLAADRVLQSNAPLAATRVSSLPPGVAMTQTISFNSMLFVGDAMQLASVKAVAGGYPFYGVLKLAPQQRVRPGEIWLAPRLMALLQARIGSELELGATRLRVAGELLQEPDEGFSPFMLAPHALMHLDDLVQAQVILPGSRIEYRYLFRGASRPLGELDRQLLAGKLPGERLLKPGQESELRSRQLERSERFFRLATLIGLLLGGLAMQVAMSHFAERYGPQLALLKTLGASRRQLWAWLLGLLGLLMVVALLLGGLVGYLLHLAFIPLLGDLLPAELPPPSWQPFFVGLGMSGFITLLLCLVPFGRLLTMPALRVLRQELGSVIPAWLSLPLVLVGSLLLAWRFTGDARLSLGLLLGCLLLLLLLGALAYLLLWLWPKPRIGSALGLALTHLRRARWQSLSQLSTIALVLLLLGVLWASRAAILAGFDATLAADLPNRFLINLAQQDKPALEQLLASRKISHSRLYPVIRGRLTHIAGEAVAQAEGERGREGVNRELTMTWQAQAPAHNTLVAGLWWHSQSRGEVSVEQGVAERLGIKLGDELRFSLGGEPLTARVTSLRKVNWEDLQPNFFMIFSPDLLAHYPASWMVSLRIPQGEKQLEVELVRRFPAVTLIDTDSIMLRLQRVLDQVSRALALMLSLVTLAAVLVLFTQVQADMSRRWQELVLMRTLGASAQLLQRALRWELLATGLLAGLTAAFCSELIMLLLQQQWSELTWQPHPLLWLGLPVLGALLVWLAARAPMHRLLHSVLIRHLR